MLIPFYWMIVTSLSAPGSLDLQLIPDPVMWENYPKAWMAVNFGRGYINSMLVTMCVTFGQVFTSSMAAYAFARLDFPGRDKVFLAYLATMMIPKDVTMIPNFILLKYIPEGLNILFSPENLFWTQDLFLFGKYYMGKPIGYDSYFALIMPGLFSAYGTFMLRQFFMTIPTDLEDAAKIDGCSYFGIYWRVILPLSKPALATLTTFTFMGSWKEFMWPLVITSSLDMKTLPILLQYFQGLYFTEWNLLMAGSVIMVIPALIMFLFAQRYFVEGIQLGAIKG
ncbi:carbohydrate ABC transporter permease [PVC group bacterium]|nr:carbohydrate ABC transporter permease [PVC group bacterium]